MTFVFLVWNNESLRLRSYAHSRWRSPLPQFCSSWRAAGGDRPRIFRNGRWAGARPRNAAMNRLAEFRDKQVVHARGRRARAPFDATADLQGSLALADKGLAAARYVRQNPH
jgi:hypothetical protein